MGIPKFFRWISERYPACSQLVTETSVPPFDKFYLDMNGIIHHCSHGNSPGLKRPNAAVFADILGYLELLVAKIRPKQVLYLAVDGVAPRAKMNQQRARRFRSAQEAKAQLAKSNIAQADSFDSNCITPGTVFMDEFCTFMREALAEKVAKDPNWASFTTIFSGPDVPGEGEHKIMHYIRTCKAQPDYDANMRHCLYGLDADLILLGLLSHDPHFALLREEVKFNSRKSKSSASGPARFYLMHLGLLREYIGLEFSNNICEYSLDAGVNYELFDEDEMVELAEDMDEFSAELNKICNQMKQLHGFSLAKAPPGFSAERVIDDIILLMTLVGNDFLPHLPHLHIHDCAVAIIWAAYKRIQKRCEPGTFRYVNEFGRVQYDVLRDILRELLPFERECYLREGALQFDVPTLSNRERNLLRSLLAALEFASARDVFEWQSPAGVTAEDCRLLGRIADESGLEYAVGMDKRIRMSLKAQNDPLLLKEICRLVAAYIHAPPVAPDDADGLGRWKQHYHDRKLGHDVSREMVIKDYLSGMQWVMSYYYDGVGSWSWFYPHHYAPHLSDVYDFLASLKSNFVVPPFAIGEPFSPLNQLMSVLPPESAALIPVPALRTLLTNETSPLADFYPRKFRSDLNGKRNSWEAVVLIPFIDEARLVDTVRRCLPRDYVAPEPGCDWEYLVGGGPPQPFTLPPIPAGLLRGLCAGVKESPGFPRLGYLPHARPHLCKAGVNLFPPLQPSNNHTLCLFVEPPIESVEGSLRAEACFNWPFVVEAKVLYADNGAIKTYPTGKGQTSTSPSDPQAHSRALHKQADYWYKRFGVQFESDVLVYGHVIEGMQLHSDGSLHRKWSPTLACMPWALVVPLEGVRRDERFKERRSVLTVEAFAPGTHVLCPKTGRRGLIRESLRQDGRLAVHWLADPFVPADVQRHRQPWKPSHQLARDLQISPHLLARLSASLYVFASPNANEHSDIGLGIKFEGREKAALGYTRRHAQGHWEFSSEAESVLRAFVGKFHGVLRRMERDVRPVVPQDQIDAMLASLKALLPERNRLRMVDAQEDRLDSAVVSTLSFRKVLKDDSSRAEWVPAAGLITSQLAHLSSSAPKNSSGKASTSHGVALGQPVYVCDRLAFGNAAYVVAKTSESVEVKLEEPGPTGLLLSLPITSIMIAKPQSPSHSQPLPKALSNSVVKPPASQWSHSIKHQIVRPAESLSVAGHPQFKAQPTTTVRPSQLPSSTSAIVKLTPAQLFGATRDSANPSATANPAAAPNPPTIANANPPVVRKASHHPLPTNAKSPATNNALQAKNPSFAAPSSSSASEPTKKPVLKPIILRKKPSPPQ